MKSTQRQTPLTIILPVLNADKTIEAALESIAVQTFSKYEVLILDGGSTDGTLEKIARFTTADPRFRCTSQKDAGIYDAMNKGIKNANGEWLFFLGSDDYLFSKDILATVYEKIMQNQGVEMVYGNVWLSTPIPPNLDTCLYGTTYSAERLLRKNICHQCIFYQRKLFKRFGLYRTKYVIFGDWDFNLRIFNKIKSLYIDKVIAFYNIDGQSGKNHHLDDFFGRDFLENMATRYSYSCKDAFFNNRKKELSGILLKQISSYKFIAAARIGRILAYQVLLPARKKLNTRLAKAHVGIE